MTTSNKFGASSVLRLRVDYAKLLKDSAEAIETRTKEVLSYVPARYTDGNSDALYLEARGWVCASKSVWSARQAQRIAVGVMASLDRAEAEARNTESGTCED